MSAINFLVELLVKAGLSRSLALQLAQTYLSRHGVAFDPARAVEQILEELARGTQISGQIVGAVGGATVVASGSAQLTGALSAGGAPPPSAATQEALAESSGGTVSTQAISAYNLTFAQALGLVSYQLGAQSTDLTSLDAQIYEELSQGGLLDAPDLV